jgi:hypothetical protein
MLVPPPLLLAAALSSALLFLAAAVPTPSIASFSDACDCPKPNECDKHSCPAGCAYNPTVRHCIPAHAGFYAQLTNETSSNVDTPCPAGTYNPLTGSASLSACTACPAGTYDPSTGSSSAAACLACPAGAYSSAVASTCTRHAPKIIRLWRLSPASLHLLFAVCNLCPPGFCCPYSGTVTPIPCQSTQDCPQGSSRCPSAVIL